MVALGGVGRYTYTMYNSTNKHYLYNYTEVCRLVEGQLWN